MISSSPKRTSTRWICSSRNRTRRRMRCLFLMKRSGEPRAFQPLDASRQSFDIVAQRVHRRNELVGFSACDQIATFFLEELREIASERIAGALTEAEDAARGFADLMGGDVADQARQFFLQIRS